MIDSLFILRGRARLDLLAPNDKLFAKPVHHIAHLLYQAALAGSGFLTFLN